MNKITLIFRVDLEIFSTIIDYRTINLNLNLNQGMTMSFYLYNTMTRKKEEFQSIKPNVVSLYACGPTVYDLLHVGNFRGPVVFNLLRNWLENHNYKVNFVYNYTDVYDKIIAKAKELDISEEAVSLKYISEFKKDFSALNLTPHEANPKVTETIDEIINTISSLVAQNKAYASNGNVYFNVSSFDGYGKLSGRKTEDLKTGSRIAQDQNKKNPHDFALWKKALENEISWESPWGKGRPGWHIECTSMIHKHLGEQIDIHAGGLDLLFPHHENEIAQSEASCGKKYANYWVHNNMFTFGGSKMSKSAGNIKTMRNFLNTYPGEVYKYLVLSVHYRSECEFNEKTIHQAIKGLSKFYSAKSKCEAILKTLKSSESKSTDEWQNFIDDSKNTENLFLSFHEKINEALNDDLNTPEVLARLFEATKILNQKVPHTRNINEKTKTICYFYLNLLEITGKWLSVFSESGETFLNNLDSLWLQINKIDRTEIDKKVQERLLAKNNKDYKLADQYRDELTQLGISVMDGPEGSTWEVIR